MSSRPSRGRVHVAPFLTAVFYTKSSTESPAHSGTVVVAVGGGRGKVATPGEALRHQHVFGRPVDVGDKGGGRSLKAGGSWPLLPC